MTERTCLGCGVAMLGRTARAKYCSNACAKWVRNGNTELRVAITGCVQCGKSLAGKMVTAIYCTVKCKLAASEQRRVRDDRARYLKERDRRIAYATAYAAANPQVGQRTKRKRKAALAGAGIFAVSARDWRRLCDRYGNRCCYCREARPLTMDHVIPVIRGGRHSIGNLLPACMSCNASKNRRTVMEWRLSRLRGGDSHPLEAKQAG